LPSECGAGEAALGSDPAACEKYDGAETGIVTEKQEARARAAPANAIHMVRTTQQAHYQLSQMADQKASILMGATFVIFTITIGQAKNGGPPLPLLVLGGFAFFAAALAVLLLPAIGPRRGGPVNLLFFGSFAQLDREDYIERVLNALESDESVYRTMADDIWQNGKVLAHKKYRLLGYAYRVFLVGLTASFLTFLGQRFL